jgi:eukaryotic-like serine/threonine-protein kinase
VTEEPIVLGNRYQLQERLGSGGMAMVYRAQDLMLERTVAVKILRRDFSHSEEFRQRFRQEAKAAANLSHPNIVTIHDFGIDTNQLFIVMEYVPGTDIKSLLKQRGKFPISQAVDLMIQACAGIGYAHRAGLVHCDIKPQNLLVTPDNRLKVLDFGIARALATISPDEQSDVVWGSPLYFSPEQAVGNAPSPASDVYSLGVVLYEMLTGQTPFTGKTSEELVRQHRDSLPPSPRKFTPAIPPALENILLKVLSKEPSARYRTADQFGSVLANLRQQTAAKQTAVPQPAPSGKPAPEPRIFPPSANHSPQAQPQARPVTLSAPLHPAQPVHPPVVMHAPSQVVIPQQNILPKRNNPSFDWLTWLLALLALIAAGGLIPFWLWVYYTINLLQ